ncbi:MAG: hypothetical protein AAGN66_17885 [Acidobacteriota bacterium]
MAEVSRLKTLMDLYAVGVRAGVITPQRDDEEYFRKLADLLPMSDETLADWRSSDGVRKPITLLQDEEVADGEPEEEETT